MGKKRKHKKKTFCHKMPFWKIVSRHYGIGIEDNNNFGTYENVSSEQAFTPSSKALIYASELQYIAKCIQDYPDIETGGQLFGAWTASGAPRVIYAIGPGPRANHKGMFFNQDINYLETIGAKLKEYGLQHIGEWHSHHKIGLSYPSSHDAQTMQNSITHLNLSRILLCIGSINRQGILINAFNFARDTHYVEAEWEIVDTNNRLRAIIDFDLKDILRHPQSTIFNFAKDYIKPKRTAVGKEAGWFSNFGNRKSFNDIIDTLKAQNWVLDVIPKISEEGIVTLEVSYLTFTEIIKFPSDFPRIPFEIDKIGVNGQTLAHYNFYDTWVIRPSLAQTFIHNYHLHSQDHH